MTCRKCSKPLPERSGRGRPALYCSTGCRRAAEYEIRRLQATIERLEGKILHHREAIALDRSGCGLICCGLVPAQRRHLDVLTEQLAAAEQRFAVLLDDGGPTEDAG